MIDKNKLPKSIRDVIFGGDMFNTEAVAYNKKPQKVSMADRNKIRPTDAPSANVNNMPDHLYQAVSLAVTHATPNPDLKLSSESIRLASHVLHHETWTLEADMCQMALCLKAYYTFSTDKGDKFVTMLFSWWNSEVSKDVLGGLGT